MNPALSQDKRYELMSSRDMAYIAVVFATGRRCDDVAMANLLISQMFLDGSIEGESCLVSSLGKPCGYIGQEYDWFEEG